MYKDDQLMMDRRDPLSTRQRLKHSTDIVSFPSGHPNTGIFIAKGIHYELRRTDR